MRRVIDAGENDHAFPYMLFVFFALLDGAVVAVAVFHRGEALHRLGSEIAVGHRMAHDDGVKLALFQNCRDASNHRVFARSRCALHRRKSPGAMIVRELRSGPIKRKSAPQARTREAMCMTRDMR